MRETWEIHYPPRRAKLGHTQTKSKNYHCDSHHGRANEECWSPWDSLAYFPQYEEGVRKTQYYQDESKDLGQRQQTHVGMEWNGDTEPNAPRRLGGETGDVEEQVWDGECHRKQHGTKCKYRREDLTTLLPKALLDLYSPHFNWGIKCQSKHRDGSSEKS